MFKLSHPPTSPLFHYYAPLGKTALGVLSIPHSGESIPREFEAYLSGDQAAYRSDVDFKVHELVDIEALQRAGVAVLVANVHRICVDLNRAESNCVLFWKENTQGKKLVLKDPDAAETQRLIGAYHRPYYEVLKTGIKELEKIKKLPVSVVDLHSMPSMPTAYHLKQNPQQRAHRPDFCLSDRRGLTCGPEFIAFFRDELSIRGYEASLNDPYIGGHVTEFVNQFRTNNIQIEIKRGIYMDENRKELVPERAARVKQDLTEVLLRGFQRFDS